MAAHAYSCYRVKTNAETRLARFRQEFPGGVAEVIEIEAGEGFVYSDGVL